MANGLVLSLRAVAPSALQMPALIRCSSHILTLSFEATWQLAAVIFTK